jgi:hypothetical protein
MKIKWFKKKKKIIWVSKDSGLKQEHLKNLDRLIDEDNVFFVLIEGDPNRIISEQEL